MKNTAFALAILVSLAPAAGAEVVRVEIARRADVGTSGYEKLVGTIYFAVDPAHPRNTVVADLDKAKKNGQGLVEFSADLYILQPKDAARRNGVALVEVSNRGNKGLLSGFARASGSRDPATENHLGDGFLTAQGYTLVWVGWQFDVAGEDGIKLYAPVAAGTSGIVRADFTPNERQTEAVFVDLSRYTPADVSADDTTLTVRDGAYGKKDVVARAQWELRGNTVTLTSGFEPGRTYELSYRVRDLPVTGTGLAAFRDTASWLKHQPDAAARVRYAYAFGSSQSGRFLRTFLYYGFNNDEKNRIVYDGVMAHIAGAGKISINERGATPNASAASNVTNFPFTNVSARDPISGRSEGLLDNDRARQNQPKVFFTNSAVEYWNTRAAALTHTTPDGRTDVAPPDNTRIYFLAGTQHSPGQFPPRRTTGQQLDNPVQYWWTLRALLTAMDNWVRQGSAPPASQYPKLIDGTLVRREAVTFPAIPDVQSPQLIQPARQGSAPLPFLVPQVDDDGNERAGIRSVEQAVPVATYTGWNFRSTAVGAPKEPVSLMGSSIPFAATDAARKPGDARRSLALRYTSKEEYLTRARAHADTLVKAGYLLAADVPQVIKRMEELWALARQGEN
jgi:Alpha/beta hydrolase domain